MKWGIKRKSQTKIPLHRIKAIIFDVGGVLVLGKYSKPPYDRHHTLGVHDYISKELNISLDQYFDSIDTTYALAIEGKLSNNKILKVFAKNLNSSIRNLKKIYILAYKKHFKQNKQLFEQVFKLKKYGYKVAVLSDQWCLSQKALMPKKLYKKFDEVIVSCKVKLRKPNPKIYQLILSKLKLKPQEILFIDNQNWNIKPAKKLGMKTILFKDNKHLFNEKLWRNLFEK